MQTGHCRLIFGNPQGRLWMGGFRFCKKTKRNEGILVARWGTLNYKMTMPGLGLCKHRACRSWSWFRWRKKMVRLVPVKSSQSCTRKVGISFPRQVRLCPSRQVRKTAGGRWDLKIMWVGEKRPQGDRVGRDIVWNGGSAGSCQYTFGDIDIEQSIYEFIYL